ncbi:MAG: hypothetical protein ACR2JC_05585 [Chloroflexota bacterium]
MRLERGIVERARADRERQERRIVERGRLERVRVERRRVEPVDGSAGIGALLPVLHRQRSAGVDRESVLPERLEPHPPYALG